MGGPRPSQAPRGYAPAPSRGDMLHTHTHTHTQSHTGRITRGVTELANVTVIDQLVVVLNRMDPQKKELQGHGTEPEPK